MPFKDKLSKMDLASYWYSARSLFSKHGDQNGTAKQKKRASKCMATNKTKDKQKRSYYYIYLDGKFYSMWPDKSYWTERVTISNMIALSDCFFKSINYQMAIKSVFLFKDRANFLQYIRFNGNRKQIPHWVPAKFTR